MAESRKSASTRTLPRGECQAVSIGQNPSYGPLGRILEADAGFSTNDDSATRYEKLSQRLDLLIPEEHDRQLTALAALLSLPSEAEARGWLGSLEDSVFRERLQEAVSQYLERLACECPLVLVWEDVHWLDASSAALIDQLLALTETSPLLFLLVARPELGGSLLDRASALPGVEPSPVSASPSHQGGKPAPGERAPGLASWPPAFSKLSTNEPKAIPSISRSS